jgi:hypothetical protein
VSLKVKQVKHAFDKLEMIQRNGNDRLAYFIVDGRPITFSKVPHKQGDLKGLLPHFIRQELKLNEKQFRDLISCPLKRTDYITILKNKGLIR